VPENRQQGATRGDECIPGKELLTALVPASGIGETIAEYPTVFWYMPKTSASAVEFVLRDANGDEVYKAQYALEKSAKGVVSTPGIMSLSLPTFANLSPLKIGEDYHWQLALICNPLDRSIEPYVEGSLKRVQPNPTLALRVQQATLQDRVALYADARLWYETLATLVELRRDRPNDNDIANAWEKLLKSVGLDTFAKK
jgi:hypothetical protein